MVHILAGSVRLPVDGWSINLFIVQIEMDAFLLISVMVDGANNNADVAV